MESRYLSLVLLALLVVRPALGISQSTTPQSGGVQSQEARPVAGAEEPTAPTEISADLGGCSALITVTGSNAKPIFNAKVTTRVRYGAFGARKLDLEVYTSASGQVKIIGLPESPKRPISFQIGKGEKQETVDFKPDASCNATFHVQLK